MSKDEKITISVHTYNWGPCVVKVKIQDDFKKAFNVSMSLIHHTITMVDCRL
jgi:hypothetical protein